MKGNEPLLLRFEKGPPFWWPEALPGTDLDYGANVCGALCAAGDKIARATVAIEPSGTLEMQALDLQVGEDLLLVELAGGQPGRVYTNLITLTGTSGRVWATTVRVRVGLGGALRWETPPAPVPGYGAPIIWTPEAVMIGLAFSQVMTGLVGLGTNQATALPILALVNEIASVPAGTGFVLQATDFVSGTVVVQNDDPANDAPVYPPVGAVINALGVNAPLMVPHGGGRRSFSTASPSTYWFAG